MKVFEATISALACGLDVIPRGQVVDLLKLSAFAILIMQSGKYHSRSANTALPALKLKCASLASVFVLREFAQTITVLLQCLVALAKVQSEPLSTRLKGGGFPSRQTAGLRPPRPPPVASPTVLRPCVGPQGRSPQGFCICPSPSARRKSD